MQSKWTVIKVRYHLKRPAEQDENYFRIVMYESVSYSTSTA
jgi:hypothetical protein